MKDLSDLLDLSSINESRRTETDSKFSAVLFSQTQECVDLVLSAFRFEGISAPDIVDNYEDEVAEYVQKSNLEIVIIELNKSEDVARDAEHLGRLLPTNTAVIIIGSEDAISTIRKLKDLGFYYIFWPVPKEEFIDFVNNVYKNRERNKNIGKTRTAKQVAIIGTKGGVGVSFITAELAYLISHNMKSNSVIVDCDYASGDQDILLGIKNFKKLDVNMNSLDASGEFLLGESFTKKIDSQLSLFAIDSEDIQYKDLFEYTMDLSKQLDPKTSFVFYDLSASISFQMDFTKQAKEWDVVILIVEPSISSVRETAKYLKMLSSYKDDKSIRVLTVFNYTRSSKGLLVTKQDAEEYLSTTFDVVIPHYPDILGMFLKGKHVGMQDTSVGECIKELAHHVLGEEVEEKKSRFSIFSSLRGRS